MSKNKRVRLLIICILIITSFILITLGISYALFGYQKKGLITNSITTATIKECEYYNNTVWNFDYTGDNQSFTVPCTGTYKIELWGASGYEASSLYPSGKGGYTTGDIILSKNKNLHVIVGGQGIQTETSLTCGGYNGGGCGNVATFPHSDSKVNGGGGATDIRIDRTNFNSRIMVAGAGGGSAHFIPDNFPYEYTGIGGAGGGLESYTGYSPGPNTCGTHYTIGFAKQNGNYISEIQGTVVGGTFGYGAIGNDDGAGGGGGWYGGPAMSCHYGGSGGSSYISGHAGSLAVSSENSTSLLTGCTSESTTIKCSNSYTGYSFTNTKMIDGAGYNWTTIKEDYQGMPTHDGSSTMIGNSGNGYAKITLIKASQPKPEKVTTPVITGGSASWAINRTISVLTESTAVSGIKKYQYYISTSNTSQVGGNWLDCTTSKTSQTFTQNGTKYIYFRAISNDGVISDVSLPQTISIDTTTPTVTINSLLPSSLTKGDSYTILGSYSATGLSGGSASCSSNINGTVTNTSSLTTGTHTITCVAKTGAGKTASASQTIKVTYTAYTATNLFVGGSFENDISNYKCYNTCPTISNNYKLYGSSSVNSKSTLGQSELALMPKTPVALVTNHKYYLAINTNYVSFTQGYKVAFYVADLGTIIGNSNSNWQISSVIATSNQSASISDIRVGKCFGHTDVIYDAYFDGARIIDLTATFGSGNEPDKVWCDSHIKFFDGTTTIYK